MLLITGSTGFVGKNLVSMIDNECVCVVRKCLTDSLSNNFYIDGLHSRTSWDGAFNNVDVVVHLAGLAHSNKYHEDDFDEVNNRATLHLATQAAKNGVKRFVFISTIGVNGTNTHSIPFSEEMDALPLSIYAKSKHNAEIGLKEISKKTGLEIVIIRPPLVYGIDAPGNFSLLLKLVNKVPVLPFGFATNSRDFISVNNLCDFILLCSKHPNAANQTFVISDGKPTSIHNFTNEISRFLGKKTIQLPIPKFVIKTFTKILGKSHLYEQLFGNLEIDISKAKKLLSWEPIETLESAFYNKAYRNHD